MNRLSFGKVYYHLDHLVPYLSGKDPFPVHMTVGLTNFCNHACIWCYGHDTISSHYNAHAFADSDMIIRTVLEAGAGGLRSITLVGTGEPTLHKDFCRIVRCIKEGGVDVATYTNGSLLDEERSHAVIDTHTFLRLSCSAVNQEEHNRIHHKGRHGNDFARIVANIRRLIALRGSKKLPTIGVQFSVSHRNIESLVDACAFWKEVGVDYFALKPVYRNPNVREHEENAAPLDRIKKLAVHALDLATPRYTVYAKTEQFETVLGEHEPRSYTTCHGQCFECFLDPDGKLYICGNMHGQEHFCLGNVYEQGSFEKVWRGERRKTLLQTLNVAECPHACRMDPLNRLIEDILCPDPTIHPNFL